MQAHQLPPHDATLDDIAAHIAAAATTAVTLADRHRGDRDHDGLDAAATILAAVDRLTAAVITVLQTTEHEQVIVDHGITRDTWLRAIAGRTCTDAGMLLAAAERLADMPAVSAWFHQGMVSWGAVRSIVAATRTLTATQRRWVDDTLADHGGDIACLDGDRVVAAVDGLVTQARPDLHRDRDTAALARRWLTLQPRLDGTAENHGALDPETAAAAFAAFNQAPTHHDDVHVGDGDGMIDADRVRAERRQANVDIFGDLCRQRLSRHRARHEVATTGDDDRRATPAAAAGGPAEGERCRSCGLAPSSARPAFLVVADLSVLHPDTPVGSGTARLHWATGRAPVELTPSAVQRLACDATLRVVVTDDTKILGVTAVHPKVSATLRAALVVRDGGCRFPTCLQPAELCDAHHIIPVHDDGPTTLDNLALICRNHHHAIHDGGWHATLHGDATMTFTRRGVTVTSVPRARQHPTPRDGPGHTSRRTAQRRSTPRSMAWISPTSALPATSITTSRYHSR